MTAKVIAYVSPDGSDANDGLAPTSPRRTIAAGAELLRHGYPDELLLRRMTPRDVYTDQTLGQWKKSGLSAQARMRVSTYGHGERPIVLTGTNGAIWTSGSGGSPASIDHLEISGLEFTPHMFTGQGDCVGAYMLQPSSYLTFEDCVFRGYSTNVVLQAVGGRHRFALLQRCAILDAHSVHGTGQHPQGVYAYGVDGLQIFDCLLDHNGWNERIPGAGADIFSHNLYLDNGCTDVDVVGNLIADAGSHGMQLRCGGLVLDNLFVGNPIHCQLGGGNDPEPLGVDFEASGNVLLESRDIDDANPRGWGFVAANTRTGSIERNIVVNSAGGSFPQMLSVQSDDQAVGIHTLSIVENRWNKWGGAVRFSPGRYGKLTFSGNDIVGNGNGDPLVVHESAGSVAAIESTFNRFLGSGDGLSWFEVEGTRRTLDEWKMIVRDQGSTVSSATSMRFKTNARRFVAHARGIVMAGGGSWNVKHTAAVRRALG